MGKEPWRRCPAPPTPYPIESMGARRHMVCSSEVGLLRMSLGGGMFGIVTVSLSLGPYPLMGIVPTPNFLRTPALNPTVISRP